MFFIHHIASSIQASSIIASVAQETIAAIDRLLPEQLGQGLGEVGEEQPLGPLTERESRAIPARRSGCIQSLNIRPWAGRQMCWRPSNPHRVYSEYHAYDFSVTRRTG